MLEQSDDLFPRNVPITIRLAETLMHSGDNKRAHLALLDLFNNVEPTPDQTRLIAKAANAAGDFADSYGYMAEFYLMTGNLMMAIQPTAAGLGPAGAGSDTARALQRAARRSARRDAEEQ